MPRRDDDYDDEDDDTPRRRQRRRRDDDDDEDDFEEEDYRPRRSRRAPAAKPGLATTAGVFWAIWCVICLLSALWTVVFVVRTELDDRIDLPEIYTPTSVCSAFLILLTAGVCGFAAFLTLSGKTKSLTLSAVLSVVLPIVVVLSRTLFGFLIGVEMSKDMPGGRSIALPMAGRSFLFAALQMSGVMLAGLFAFLANGRYREWKAAADRGRR